MMSFLRTYLTVFMAKSLALNQYTWILTQLFTVKTLQYTFREKDTNYSVQYTPSYVTHIGKVPPQSLHDVDPVTLLNPGASYKMGALRET